MQSPGFRRLLVSSALVIFGVMGQSVARGWLARDLTGSNAGLGGVFLAFGVAMLLATPFGGVAADRFPKRTVLLIAVAMMLASSVAIGIAVVSGTIRYWMLLVASVVQATAFALYLPARITFIAELVDPSQIAPAVVLSQTTIEAMRVIAPALAGVLIGWAWFGVGGVFLMAAVTSFLSGVVLVGLSRRRSQGCLAPLTARRDGGRRPVRPCQQRSRAGRADDDRRGRDRVPIPHVPARLWPTSATTSAQRATG